MPRTQRGQWPADNLQAQHQIVLNAMARRDELALSLQQVAEQSGLEIGTISSIESRARAHGPSRPQAASLGTLIAYLQGVGLTLVTTPIEGFQPPERKAKGPVGGRVGQDVAAHRRNTARQLISEGATPKTIAQELKISLSHAYNLINDIKKNAGASSETP
ncbi:hypothetical protein AB0J43_00250 [Nonomuraea fuscirosea]